MRAHLVVAVSIVALSACSRPSTASDDPATTSSEPPTSRPTAPGTEPAPTVHTETPVAPTDSLEVMIVCGEPNWTPADANAAVPSPYTYCATDADCVVLPIAHCCGTYHVALGAGATHCIASQTADATCRAMCSLRPPGAEPPTAVPVCVENGCMVSVDGSNHSVFDDPYP